MAVEAVSDVVLQNLTDLRNDNSMALDHVIVQIEAIRNQLSNYVPNDVVWANEYLRLLFSVEDEIEKYVHSLSASGRRRNTCFFRRDKILRRELHRLALEINILEEDKRSRQVVENPDPAKEENGTSATAAAAHGKSVTERLRLDITGQATLEGIKRLFSGGSSYDASRSPPSSPPGGSAHLRYLSFTSTNPDQEGPSLTGFTRDQIALAHRLMEGGGGVIPLVGRAGAGKTSLVRRIYNLREINEHFNCLAWVHADQDKSIKGTKDKSITGTKVLSNLLQQVLKAKFKEGLIPMPDELIHKVSDSLKDKTYLVVLDHVSDIKFWNCLKPAFPNLGTKNSKSKVILILRDRNVAHSISNQENCAPYHLSGLSDEDSWKLLTKKMKKSCFDEGSGQVDIGFIDEILQKCKGCPLDIVLLGGLLSTKELRFNEWKSYLNQHNWRGVKIWQLCYNDLPSHSKLCLLHMALFPNDLDIPVRRLHWLWLAEGFIKRRSPLESEMSEEDTVEECFENLLHRNFIMISMFRSDGSPKNCRLPKALHEYLSEIAHQISFFYVRQGPQNDAAPPSSSSLSPQMNAAPPSSSLLSPQLDAAPPSSSSLSPQMDAAPPSSSSLSYQYVRSYISFNSQRNDTPAKEVGSFISTIIQKKGFGVLRVLDLEGVYKPTLPETLKQLFNLRYLGLRWTFIDYLPKSVGDLPCLETLDLKRTYINSLPNSIWKLERLRHLNLPGIRLNYKHKKRHNSSLTELRALEGLIVDDETDVKEELSHLCELRELGITCQLSSSSELMSWIQNLTNLRFLWLKSKDEMGQPSEIDFKSLAKLSHLSRVNILGHLKKLPDSPFPPNLKVLALSVSRLNDDPMPVLSLLPNLSVLRLLADSYLGKTIKCPKNGFQNLRMLKLWMLKELEDWTMEGAGMPLLKQLNIRYCNKLKQLPSQLLDQGTLEKLILTSMPEDFVQQVEERLQEIQRPPVLNLNKYDFTPLPWEKDPDLWKEL